MKIGRQISVFQGSLLPPSPMKMEAAGLGDYQIRTRIVSEWAKCEFVVIYR
jgi:hypothetical protein